MTATRKLIEDRGVAHITSKQIAKAAGCAEGTIFPYFARKEDLLLAAVLANFPSFKESLMAISGGSSRQRLRRLGLNIIRFFEQITPAAVAVLSDAELTRRHREVVRERNGGPQRLYTAVMRFIESEQASGALHPDLSSVDIASTLLGPCFFRVFTRLSLGNQPVGRRRLVEHRRAKRVNIGTADLGVRSPATSGSAVVLMGLKSAMSLPPAGLRSGFGDWLPVPEPVPNYPSPGTGRNGMAKGSSAMPRQRRRPTAKAPRLQTDGGRSTPVWAARPEVVCGRVIALCLKSSS